MGGCMGIFCITIPERDIIDKYQFKSIIVTNLF